MYAYIIYKVENDSDLKFSTCSNLISHYKFKFSLYIFVQNIYPKDYIVYEHIFKYIYKCLK